MTKNKLIKDKQKISSLNPSTKMTLLGRAPDTHAGFVNTPTYRGSTVLFKNTESYRKADQRYCYGRPATPSTDSLSEMLTDFEGGEGVVFTNCGLSAISLALFALTKHGDHVLIADNTYGPSRRFADSVLKKYGVSYDFFPVSHGGDLSEYIQKNTRVVLIESPGSQSMEVLDVPKIVEQAHKAGAKVVMDNTWATPLFFKAHDFGVDVTVISGSKYYSGASDLLFGTVSAIDTATLELICNAQKVIGIGPGPEEVMLVMRGLRTLPMRLEYHQKAGYEIANWLKGRPEVKKILHPMFEECPGHVFFKRDFKGASGLFSILLNPVPEKAVNAFIDELSLFGLGASWGGYESLVTPFNCKAYRTAEVWDDRYPALRFSIGMESQQDLIDDLARGFAALKDNI